MKSLFRMVAVLGAAWLSVGAAPAWLGTVAVTPEGHRLGNPEARVKLVAYESYTCPHCADFEAEAADTIRVGYIQTGKLSLEVRHYVRDPVDLTAAMLTECVPPAKFFNAHRAFYLNYKKWIPVMAKANEAQSNRWYVKDGGAARRNIASDFGFYNLMTPLGLSRPAADKCLNDNALAAKLAGQTAATDKKYPDFEGTPSFLLNGLLLIATHQWDLLRPQIEARL